MGLSLNQATSKCSTKSETDPTAEPEGGASVSTEGRRFHFESNLGGPTSDERHHAQTAIEGGAEQEVPYLLPTSLSLAKHGTQEFSELLKALPPRAERLFRTAQRIKRCFTGVTPEVRFEEISEEHDQFSPAALADIRANPDKWELPREALLEAQSVINSAHSDFYVLHTLRGGEASRESFQIVNLAAVRQVIDNYPSFFLPEAKAHTREWITRNIDWGDPITYGIISGFPPDAVLAYMKGEAQDSVYSDVSGIAFMGNAEKHASYVTELDQIYANSGIEGAATAHVVQRDG